MKSSTTMLMALLITGMTACGGATEDDTDENGADIPFATVYEAADAQEKTEREKNLLATVVYDFGKGLNLEQSLSTEYVLNWESLFAYAASGAPLDPADYLVEVGNTITTTIPSMYANGEYEALATVTEVQLVPGFEATDIGGIEFVVTENIINFGDYAHSISDISGDWNNCNVDVESLRYLVGSAEAEVTATASNVVFTPYTQLELDLLLEQTVVSTDLVVEVAGISFDITLNLTSEKTGIRENSEEGFQISYTGNLDDISGEASINGVSYTLDELRAALPNNDFTAFCTP